ncbi:MAG: cation:proton antiporter [Rhodospirillales bacterium]|nr:cation:proton antiporter [Rhodospirillales bacterium]
MFSVAAIAVLVTMVLTIYRAIKGPTVYDRILAVNAFGTLTVVLIAVYGFLSGRPEFLDLALVYALINFIGTIAVSKYVEFSHMGRPSGGDELGDI